MSFLKDQGPMKPSHLAQANGREGRGGMELEVSRLRGRPPAGPPGPPPPPPPPPRGGRAPPPPPPPLDNATQPVAAWEQT